MHNLRKLLFIISIAVTTSCKENNDNLGGVKEQLDELISKEEWSGSRSEVVRNRGDSNPANELNRSARELKESLVDRSLSTTEFLEKWKELATDIDRLSEIKLDQLLENLRSEEPMNKDLLKVAYCALAKFRPMEALSYFIKEVEKGENPKTYYGALETIAKNVPKEFCKVILKSPNALSSRNFCKKALEALVKVDLKLAREFAEALDKNLGKLEFISQYRGALALVDFDSALDDLKNEEGPGKQVGLISIAHKLMSTDPENALRALKEVNNLSRTRLLVVEAYGKIASFDSGRAAELLLDEDQKVLNAVFQDRNLVNQISSLGLDKTAEILSKLPYLEGNSSGFQSAALALVRREPLRVMEWVKNFPTGASRSEILNSTFNAFAFDDIESAKLYFESSSGDDRDSLISGLIKGWSLNGPESPGESFKWLQTQTIPDTRKAELALEGISLASQKFPQSVVWILQENNTGEVLKAKPGALEDIYRGVGESFSKSDRNEGKKWIETFDNSGSLANQEGFRGFFKGWLKEETDAAVLWMKSLKNSELRKVGESILDDELGGQ